MGTNCGCSQDNKNQNQGKEFDWKKDSIPMVISGVLFSIGLVFYDELHDTPYFVGEYVVYLQLIFSVAGVLSLVQEKIY